MVSSGFAWAAQSSTPLVLAVYEWRPKAELLARWQPLADYLSRSLNGRPVKVVVLNEQEINLALDTSSISIDFLLINPRYYTQLRFERQLTGALASQIEREDDLPVRDVGGAIFVRADNPNIQALADLKGKRIGIAGTEYMGAYLAPAHALVKSGVLVGRDTALETYKGNQVDVLNALGEGKVDAAFVRAGLLEELAGKNRLDPAQFRLIGGREHPGYPWQVSTELYPNWPFVAMKHVDGALAATVAGALFSINADDAIAKAAGVYGFSVPGDYIKVEDALRQLRLPPFAGSPVITTEDVWLNFKPHIAAVLAAISLIVLLSLALLLRTYQLTSSRKALQVHQGTLEARVAEKTKELSDALKKFDDFMSMAPTAFAIVGHDGRVHYMNPAFETLFGYTTTDIPDMETWWLRAYPDPEYRKDRRDTWNAVLAESMSKKTNVKGFEGHVCCKSGALEWVDAYAQITADAVNIALVDITSRKQQEVMIVSLNQALEARAAEAEAASIAKSTFLAQMSHEIRTPMNAILGFAHLLKKEQLTLRQADRVTRIGTAAEHLLSLIDDILDISKIEAGKVSLERVDFDVTHLLTQITSLMALRTQAKGLELILDIEDLPASVHGDPVRVRQILINYLGNAVKFTDSGLVILRGRICAQNAETITLLFEVEDSGPGIHADNLGKIFGAFEQEDSSTTRKFGGSGLGLAINKHLAHLMGGDVGVRSVPGKGSTFWASITLEKSQATNVKQVPSAVDGLRVLVVDDVAVTRRVHTRLMETSGATAQAVATGSAALEAVQSAASAGQPFDLLLIDLQMEGLNGFATLRAIRALSLKTLPVAILVTLSNDANIHEDAEAAGFDGVLTKPLTMESLEQTLRGRAADAADTITADQDAEKIIMERHAGKMVLLAEDDPVNQMIACEMLQSAGLTVTVADDGLAACEALEKARFDLVILDMQMPRLDGVGAAQRIRQMPSGQKIPVIAMTANAFAEDREKCLAAGMNDFISKPVSPDVLFATLLRWLEANAH